MHSVGNWSYYAGLSKTWLHIRHDDAVKGRSGSKDISPKHVDSAAHGGEYAPPRVFEALGFDFFNRYVFACQIEINNFQETR